jgi:hypothetical protein
VNKLLLVPFVLILGCSNSSYIGETEKEYRAKNEGKIADDSKSTDSTIYKTCMPQRDAKYSGRYNCTYSIFKNGICTRIYKEKGEIIEFRKL